eukprot:14980090-Heterocapsa_arctica.AAC.1
MVQERECDGRHWLIRNHQFNKAGRLKIVRRSWSRRTTLETGLDVSPRRLDVPPSGFMFPQFVLEFPRFVPEYSQFVFEYSQFVLDYIPSNNKVIGECPEPTKDKTTDFIDGSSLARRERGLCRASRANHGLVMAMVTACVAGPVDAAGEIVVSGAYQVE